MSSDYPLEDIIRFNDRVMMRCTFCKTVVYERTFELAEHRIKQHLDKEHKNAKA